MKDRIQDKLKFQKKKIKDQMLLLVKNAPKYL